MAALPLLANPAELARTTGRSASDSGLLAALTAASRAFRGAARNDITRRRDDDYQLDGTGGRSLRLPPPWPIIVDGDNPFEIRVDDVLVPPANYRLNKRTGQLTLRGGRIWPAPPADIQVSYTHGYTATIPTGGDAGGPLIGLPEDIQEAVLERAQIELNVVPGVSSRTVLGDTVSFGGSAVGATQKWVDVVEVYRLRTGDEA